MIQFMKNIQCKQIINILLMVAVGVGGNLPAVAGGVSRPTVTNKPIQENLPYDKTSAPTQPPSTTTEDRPVSTKSVKSGKKYVWGALAAVTGIMALTAL
jgi:hypothetical protein